MFWDELEKKKTYQSVLLKSAMKLKYTLLKFCFENELEHQRQQKNTFDCDEMNMQISCKHAHVMKNDLQADLSKATVISVCHILF